MRCAICLISALALPAAGVRAEPGEQPSKFLVVVAAPNYHEAIRPWIDHRRAQGYQVEQIDPVTVLGANEGNEAAELLSHEIARRVAKALMQPIDSEGRAGPAGYV